MNNSSKKTIVFLEEVKAEEALLAELPDKSWVKFDDPQIELKIPKGNYSLIEESVSKAS